MRLGDNKFYNLFTRLVTASNPDRDCDEWSHEGVHWRRSRHVHWAPLSFQIETYRLTHAARPRWSLIFVHETWWGENREGDPQQPLDASGKRRQARCVALVFRARG